MLSVSVFFMPSLTYVVELQCVLGMWNVYRSKCGTAFKLAEFLLESPSHSHSGWSAIHIASLLLPAGTSHYR